jgi:hypothetical protein
MRKAFPNDATAIDGFPPSASLPGKGGALSFLGRRHHAGSGSRNCDAGYHCIEDRRAVRLSFVSSGMMRFSGHALVTFGACPEQCFIALHSKGHKNVSLVFIIIFSAFSLKRTRPREPPLHRPGGSGIPGLKFLITKYGPARKNFRAASEALPKR